MSGVSHRFSLAALALALCAILGSAFFGRAALAQEKLAIKGYDPVAYFTLGRATPGTTEFEHVWHNMRWRFATKEHRDRFVADPVRYAPQYDGFCAMGLAMDGKKYEVDPEAWAVVEGKLYLTFNREALEAWRKNLKTNVDRADSAWQASKKAQ